MEYQFFFILAALFFSAFVKGSLGMGFSTICLAILANIVELKTAISIVLLPSLFSNLMVMITSPKFYLSLKRFFWLIVMSAPGMAVGLQILRQPDNGLSVLILALALICYGVWGLYNQNLSIPERFTAFLNPVVGFLTGIVNGATGSQILPVTPYLLSLEVDKSTIIQTLNISFTINSIIMLCALLMFNALDTVQMISYSLGVVPVAFGVWLGGKMHKRLSDALYKRLVMSLVIFLGCLLLLR